MSDTLQLAQDLIARRSLTPQDDGCLDIIGARLEPLGFKLERMRCGKVDNLWARRGTAISRGEILQEVWDLNPETRTRVVDTFVLRLRKLMADTEAWEAVTFDGAAQAPRGLAELAPAW